jgi:hypothetical protein
MPVGFVDNHLEDAGALICSDVCACALADAVALDAGVWQS